MSDSASPSPQTPKGDTSAPADQLPGREVLVPAVGGTSDAPSPGTSAHAPSLEAASGSPQAAAGGAPAAATGAEASSAASADATHARGTVADHADPAARLRARVLEACSLVVEPIVRADGGRLFLVGAQPDLVAVHLAGQCSGCPGFHLTSTFVVEPALRSAAPGARVVVTSGFHIPKGAVLVPPPSASASEDAPAAKPAVAAEVSAVPGSNR